MTDELDERDTSLTTRVAKAISQAYFKLDGMRVSWEDLREDTQENWRDVARAAIKEVNHE